VDVESDVCNVVEVVWELGYWIVCMVHVLLVEVLVV